MVDSLHVPCISYTRYVCAKCDRNVLSHRHLAYFLLEGELSHYLAMSTSPILPVGLKHVSVGGIGWTQHAP